MELHNLRPSLGSTKKSKRVGRGQGSTRGGTSTRGHKGAKSRSGYSRKRAFEGGQMPLQMRIPKRGFKNPNRTVYKPINISRLETLSEKLGTNELTIETFVSNGIVNKNDRIKILGTGEVSKAFTVTAHAVSDAAKASIEAKGGSVNLFTK